MKKLFLLLLVLGNCTTSSAEEVNIKLRFYKEGKEIAANKDFHFFIVVGDSGKKIIIEPRLDTMDNSFVMPETCGYDKGYIVCNYKRKYYAIGIDELTFSNDMVWTFYYDKKPYNREYHYGEKQYKDNKAIIILSISIKDNNIGIVQTIPNCKQYFKNSRGLVHIE